MPPKGLKKYLCGYKFWDIEGWIKKRDITNSTTLFIETNMVLLKHSFIETNIRHNN